MSGPEESTSRLALVNGQHTDSLSIFDRGLAYGDGLFETIRIINSRPILLDEHLDRLAAGLSRLAIQLALNDVKAQCLLLIEQAGTAAPGNGVIKIIVTRGSGGRGFRYERQLQPTLIVSWHPQAEYPARLSEQGVVAHLCETRLPDRPALAGLKHLNCLEYVLAAAELPAVGADEGLLLDASGCVIEASSSNVFFVMPGGSLQTPCLARAGVAGVMRAYILDHVLPPLGMACTIAPMSVSELDSVGEMFVCNSVYGVRPVAAIAGRQLTIGDTSRRVQQAVNGLFDV